MNKHAVLMSHDGGLDDYVSVMLLLTMERMQTLGVVVSPADCYIDQGVAATRKIMDLMDCSDIPVAEAKVRGVNPFPRAYRHSSFHINNLPILNERAEITTPLLPETGQEFIVRTLREADRPLTFLETGPLTALAVALDMAPDIESKIERVVWMGAALTGPGNVSPRLDYNVDGSASWNAYWDPPAVHRVWQTDIPLIVCTVEITRNVPVTPDFLQRLSRQRHYPLCDLGGLAYSLVTHQPYFMTDMLTTTYLDRPDLFTTRQYETAVIPYGPSQGRTIIQQGGRELTVLQTVDVEGFYDYVLKQWAR